MTRQHKTERQRAEEALGVAKRKLDKLRATEQRLEQQLKDVKNERLEAERLYAYRAQNPALPAPAPTTGTSSTTIPPKETSTS